MHRLLTRRRRALPLLLVACACAPADAPADEHDHEDIAPVTITHFGPEVGLFLEFPQLVPGEAAAFLAHMTLLESGQPVRQGKVVLRLEGGGGAPLELVADGVRREGLFVPEHTFNSAATYQGTLILSGPEAETTIDLGQIVVHPDEETAAHAAAPEVEPEGHVSFLLEQAWPIALITRPIERRRLVHRLRAHAVVEACGGAEAVVAAPIAGRLLAPDGGKLPVLGEQVEAGQVLGWVELPASSGDLAAWVANDAALQTLETELRMKELELSTRALEVEQTVHEAVTRHQFAADLVQRLEGLAEKGLGKASELAAARRDLALTERAREGGEALRIALQEARAGMAELRAGAPLEASSAVARRLPLVAPIAGEVVAVNHVQGESVDELAAVLRLLDLDPVWLRVDVTEYDLAGMGAEDDVHFTFPAFPDERFDLPDLGGTLVHRGREIDQLTRTTTLRYELPNPGGRLRIGLHADAGLATVEASAALALPESAIVTDAGVPVAFVVHDGESFERRELDLGVRDGGWVEVRSGISEGERVVVRGAYAVRLAAAAPSSFAAHHH